MAKTKTRKGNRSRYVTVSARSYGAPLKGARIYYEGPRPSNLRDDGTIQFGKHILQLLGKKYKKFRWIITPAENSIKLRNGVASVRTSRTLLGQMGKESWARKADIMNDIVRRFFSVAYPANFAATTTSVYVPGTLSGLLDPSIVPRLSSDDKQAIAEFLPDYLASEKTAVVSQLKATAEIDSLKTLADDMEREMSRTHAESWWQDYIKSNILLMQQGYIKAIDKLNVAIGDTKFPDFCLITHDNYLDILEIKKPDTPTLKHDTSRGNYYWDAEMARAVSQTENYIEQVNSKAAEVRSYLLDKQKINIKAVRPRGIILAGDARNFGNQKERDDFRLLSQGIKAITVVTYDELLARVRNYINVLEQYRMPKKRRSRKAAQKRRKARR